jgi:hypothetical protein
MLDDHTPQCLIVQATVLLNHRCSETTPCVLLELFLAWRRPGALLQVTQAGHCGQHALPDLWAAIDTHLEAGTLVTGSIVGPVVNTSSMHMTPVVVMHTNT